MQAPIDLMVTLVLPSIVLEIRYYLPRDGRSPFDGWFSRLDQAARAKVTMESPASGRATCRM